MAIEISESAGVRSLHFGTPWVQGSMRIARPWSLELQYTREMMLPLLLQDDADWPRQVLMIGLGAGSMLKFLHRHRPDCRITAIELDAGVIAAAHQHFKVPAPDHRLDIHCADGFDWVAADRGTYDLILLDAFDRNARAHRLESAGFYAACSARLARDGWLSCNLLTLHRSHAATRRALQTVFDRGFRLLPPCEEGNVVALATRQPWHTLDCAVPGEGAAAQHFGLALDFSRLRTRAGNLRRGTQLNLLPLLSRLEQG